MLETVGTNKMDALITGQIFVDTFLNSYKKINGEYVSRDQLMKAIYKYDPAIKYREWGRNFEIAMNGKTSELAPKMDYLAEKTKGGFPSVESFSEILNESLPSQFEIVTTALTESAADVGDGLAAVGNAAITAGTWVVKLFPFIVLGVIGYALYSNKDIVKLKK